MPDFQQIAWGYELTYPEDWAHLTLGDVEGFAAKPEALSPDYIGDRSGQLLIRAELMTTGQPIEPIWNKHIGMVASMMGARDVGSAAWQLGQAKGFEAEIVLARKDERRFWVGILSYRWLLLQFSVLHLKSEFDYFQPAMTRVISSLKIIREAAGILLDDNGIPRPPGYDRIAVKDVLDDVQDPANWLAYNGTQSIGAMQAFCLREMPIHGWEITEYEPFPNQKGPGFARLQLEKDRKQITLGLLPYQGETGGVDTPARLVYKMR